MQMYIGDDEKPLNTVNIITAGDTLVIDSQSVQGLQRELIATSHHHIIQHVLGRDLTQEEDKRCHVDDSSDGQVRVGKLGLVFRLYVCPTKQTEHTIQPKEAYWVCVPYFLRREMSIDEVCGPYETLCLETDGAYHTVLEHGNEVATIRGMPVDKQVLYHLAIQNTRFLISISSDLFVAPERKLPMGSALQKEFDVDIAQSRMMVIKKSKVCLVRPCHTPDMIFTPCGHFCVHRGDRKSSDICMEVRYRCPLCKGHISGVVPCHAMKLI